MTGKMTKKKYILVYMLVFIIFATGVFFLFLKKQKSMIWNQDGGPQYYPYLIYLGRWLRDAFSRALQGDFTIRMFDFTIGFGNDVGSVARTHPLEMLSAFFSVQQAETLYSVIILLRLCLAGLAFSYCASLYRPLTWHTLTGSMIYVFSGFAVIFGVRHLIYGSAFIMLPLLIAGAERIIRGQRAWLFALAVFLGFICNYYFMYQATAACGLFILMRLFDRYLRRKHPERYDTDRELRLRGYFPERRPGTGVGRRPGSIGTGSEGVILLKLAGVYLLGLGMAMFVMFPVVASLGSSARLASQSVPQDLAAYAGWRHYYRWFLNLIIPVRSQAGGTPLNYAATAFPAIVLLLFGSFRQHRVLKASFIIGTIFIFSPMCAYVLSGFSTVSNRWIFCYSFVVGMAFVVFADEIVRMQKSQAVLMGVLTAIYVILAVFDWKKTGSVYLIWGTGMLIVCAALVWILNAVPGLKKTAPAALLVMTFLSCSVHGFLCYSGRYGNMLEEYLDRGQALSNVMDSEFARLGTAAEEEGGAGNAAAPLWRADSDLVSSNRENYSLLLGYAPTSVYNSVLSGPTTYFMMETGNSDLAAIHRIQGLDSRTVSDALANVKYYLTTADGHAHAPFGFRPNSRLSDGNNLVFENSHPLSFGFTYDSVISQSSFEKLTAMQKEQVMLDAVVLSDADAAAAQEQMGLSDLAQPSVQIEEEMLVLPESGVNAERTKNGYRIRQGGGSISFPIRRRAGFEAYARLDDFWVDKASNFAYIQTNNLRTEFSMRGPDYIYSLNRKEYLIRLGYDEADRDDVLTLELPEKGKYSLGSVSILYVPMSTYTARIDQRNEQGMRDEVFSVNQVQGSADITKDCVMVFSVPYSTGWKIYVDGEKAPVLQANVGWLGTRLTPGRHQIRLEYATPGAFPGRLISLLAWAGFILICAVPGNRADKRKRGHAARHS